MVSVFYKYQTDTNHIGNGFSAWETREKCPSGTRFTENLDSNISKLKTKIIGANWLLLYLLCLISQFSEGVHL